MTESQVMDVALDYAESLMLRAAALDAERGTYRDRALAEIDRLATTATGVHPSARAVYGALYRKFRTADASPADPHAS